MYLSALREVVVMGTDDVIAVSADSVVMGALLVGLLSQLTLLPRMPCVVVGCVRDVLHVLVRLLTVELEVIVGVECVYNAMMCDFHCECVMIQLPTRDWLLATRLCLDQSSLDA